MLLIFSAFLSFSDKLPKFVIAASQTLFYTLAHFFFEQNLPSDLQLGQNLPSDLKPWQNLPSDLQPWQNLRDPWLKLLETSENDSRAFEWKFLLFKRAFRLVNVCESVYQPTWEMWFNVFAFPYCTTMFVFDQPPGPELVHVLYMVVQTLAHRWETWTVDVIYWWPPLDVWWTWWNEARLEWTTAGIQS